jgi:hypothetical protein
MSILSTFEAARASHPFGQFGQGACASTWGGKTGCGQTSVQSLILAFKRVLPTHDAISRIIGYWRPPGLTGTSAEQLAKGLGAWHLSYRAQYGASLLSLRALTAKGPVILVVWYPRYPNWKGYRGHPTPAPWAEPAGHAGANQFGPKPAIRHWVVFAGIEAGLAVVAEPNHASGARPEKVAYDRISLAALEAAYIAGGKIAVIPTRSVA